MKITKELTDKILSYDFTSSDGLNNAFVIVYDNKIFTPKHGRMFHGSYNEAWKHFYSQMRWRVLSQVKRDFAQSLGYSDWWQCRTQFPKSDRQIWEEFKSNIFDNGFKIIQWKDAKRDVCSKSGT